MKTLNVKILTMIAAMILLYVQSYGQQYPKKDPDVTVKSIARDFAVSDSRAKQISLALNYNAATLEKVIKDKKMDPKERGSLIKKLLDERRAHVNIILNSAEIEQLKSLQEARVARLRQQSDKQRLKNSNKTDSFR